MKRIKPFILIIPMLALICAAGILILDGKRNVVAGTVSEPANEIVVTIGEIDRSAIAEADTLRKHFQFREAIAEYQKMIEKQGVPVSLKAEAEYNIGLSHTWLGEYDKAEAVFNRILETYKDDPNAVGYAQYCIAWIKTQKGSYKEAISLLEGSLSTMNLTDKELAARIQYQIGKIYLMFLNNPESARAMFQKILTVYPDTRVASHPNIMIKKGKEQK
jgi:tetratricopeptide (TPR) repeat protein